MYKVISFGEMLVDMLSNRISDAKDNGQEHFTKFPGGAPANVAAAVARLGGKSYFTGKLSRDMFGRFLKNAIAEMGVKTDYIRYSDDKKTALAFVSLDEEGERSFEFYRDDTADLDFKISDFNPCWFDGSGIFHICSNTLTTTKIFKTTLAGLKLAKSAGWLVSFDVNLRLNLWREGANPASRIWQCLALSDIIKLSKEELEYLSLGEDRNITINRMFKNGGAVVIVTDGAKPIHYYIKDIKSVYEPPTVQIVDSTGAGDAFVGGLLYSFAKEKITPEKLSKMNVNSKTLIEAIKFASLCGAYAVTKKGALTSLACQSDITSFSRG
jgi:fructokinase